MNSAVVTMISLFFFLSSCSDDKNYSESYLRGNATEKPEKNS